MKKARKLSSSAVPIATIIATVAVNTKGAGIDGGFVTEWGVVVC